MAIFENGFYGHFILPDTPAEEQFLCAFLSLADYKISLLSPGSNISLEIAINNHL